MDTSIRPSETARMRLANQRLTGAKFASAADVVRWFGAMQSQDLRASLNAIGLRMEGATEAMVQRALDEGSIVRSWPMRRTIHCMAAEDVRWMIRLLAPRAMARMKPYYRAMKITDQELARAGKVIETALSHNTQLTRPELYERLAAEGVATKSAEVDMRGLHIVVHWAQAGLICLAARRGKQATFALVDDWTPRGRDLSGNEALAELAGLYFRAHAPATMKDFAWWSGLTMAEAKRAVSLAPDVLRCTMAGGVEYWARTDSRAGSSRAPALLLPAFDEYTVAYADRSVAGEPSMLRSLGHGLAPNVIIDGRIAGTWKRTMLGQDSVIVTPTLIRSLNGRERSELDRAIRRYSKFIGCEAVMDNPRLGR